MARAAAALAAVFLLIYLPDVGHGFIQDDFRWIVESRVAGASDLLALFTTNIGFYRPIVSLSFAADQTTWRGDAFGYGLTNLALCFAAAGALFALARRIGLPGPAALAAAGVWLFNFHAVNMAVLWLSGRTALLVSLFSLLTAHAMFSGRPLLAGALSLLAMLSKEEAIALPPLFALYCLATERRLRPSRTVPMWMALAIYLVLRSQSGAFWPADAPSYYQFTFSPGGLLRNVAEYADRAGTVFAAVAIVLIAGARARWNDVAAGERRAFGFAALWVLSTYALTVLLPVRSSLYALLPSAGSALAVGVVAATVLRMRPERFRTIIVALIVVAALLVPVYRARNVRWVQLAELSERVLDTIAADAADRSAGHVVLIDAVAERFNLRSAFGALFPEALQLRVGGQWTGEIVDAGEEAGRPGDLSYRLGDGALLRIER